jgi:hypothetical protein
MLIHQNYKDLFKHSTITEIISMFQSLLDSRELRPDEALALAGAIHAGLRSPHRLDGTAYARYAQAMALLNHHMPETHQHVVANWRLSQTKSSDSKRTYDDSLFDDTAMMQVSGNRNPSEPDTDE